MINIKCDTDITRYDAFIICTDIYYRKFYACNVVTANIFTKWVFMPDPYIIIILMASNNLYQTWGAEDWGLMLNSLDIIHIKIIIHTMPDLLYCRAQWLRGRASDSRLREPGFESCAAVLKAWASFFTLQFTQTWL